MRRFSRTKTHPHRRLPYQLAFDRRGRILILTNGHTIGLDRLLPDGRLDHGFAGPSRTVYWTQMDVDRTGRIILTAWGRHQGISLVARRLPDGQPDRSFAGNG